LASAFEEDAGSWETLARSDPLWAVLSADEYRHDRLTPASEERFWSSGEEHVEHVLAILRHEIDPTFTPNVSLDFGCGVGRNLVPLARRSHRTIGLDVSPTMVERCRARLVECEATNAEVLVVGRRIDPGLAASIGPVDFVHSVLVFQHIVAAEGLALFEQLLDLLVPGGLGFVQFQGKNPGGELSRAIRELRFRHRWFNTLVLRSRIPQLNDLVMLYEYDMLDLLGRLAGHRISNVVVERTEEGVDGYGIRLYFAKFAGTDAEFGQAGRPMTVRVRP
jgi:SAM-dependent methyltransferase